MKNYMDKTKKDGELFECTEEHYKSGKTLMVNCKAYKAWRTVAEDASECHYEWREVEEETPVLGVWFKTKAQAASAKVKAQKLLKDIKNIMEECS